ncbi:MAG TPA: Fe-S cluster assembly protein SufD [Opitutae bacterium]|nr:Fe-S cluster assembly protein SufD [Opitutae bacterium]
MQVMLMHQDTSSAPTTTQVDILSGDTFQKHQASMPSNAWMQAQQAAAWNTFKSLPMPKRTEERWRFAQTVGLSLEGYTLQDKPADAEAILAQSAHLEDYAGRLIFADGHLLAKDAISEELAAQGVLWLSLEEALHSKPELLERYLFSLSTQLGSDKFEALGRAYARAGSILYVPKDVQVKSPFVAYHWASQEGASIFPQTLIIAETTSQVSLVDFYLSASGAPALACGSSHVHAGPGAKVFRKSIQNWSRKTHSFQSDTHTTERDAELYSLAVHLGGEYARFENDVEITGAGSHAKLYSLTVADDKQMFDQRSLQRHQAPNATSDLLYKNALCDTAKTIFSGMICVGKQAQQTDAYQTNRNLLLNPSAEAISLPGLEIEANDVKCSHGSTSGQIDESELFYMLARGIPKPVAQKLLTFGFFEEVIAKVDDPALADNLRLMVEEKFATREH